MDPSIDFDQVGGLDQYVRALKEMVFLPLLYPDLFDRFKVQPPRGVLFYGPPGTGERGVRVCACVGLRVHNFGCISALSILCVKKDMVCSFMDHQAQVRF